MAVFAGLLRQQIPLMMISYVLLKCGNKAARRPYRPQVIALQQRLSADGNLIELTPADINQVWADYARRHAGSAGIVDHVSFAVMRRLGLITGAFTNDATSALLDFKRFSEAYFETSRPAKRSRSTKLSSGKPMTLVRLPHTTRT